MSINILAFDGDGIGPEIMKSTLDIVEFLNKKLELKIDIKKEIIGFKLLEQKGTTFSDEVLKNAKRSKKRPIMSAGRTDELDVVGTVSRSRVLTPEQIDAVVAYERNM